MNQQPAVFVECGYETNAIDPKYRFRRKVYLTPDQIESFRNYHQNTGVYHTIMHYINPLWYQDEKGRWLINGSDSLKYGDFYLDFDTTIHDEEDYEKLKSDVKTALKYLKIILKIDKSMVKLYFSGLKGIHLIIDAKILGVEPHTALHHIYKEMSLDIARYCKNNTIDTQIYDDKRLFRMINSIHKKSGLYKIPITYEEFDKLSYAEIRRLAQSPRLVPIKPPSVSGRAKSVFDKFKTEWTEKLSRQKEFRGKILNLKVLPPCIKEMNKKIFRETIDERNNSATALTSFYMQQGISREEALARMIKWGEENCTPPLREKEVQTIVHSVYNKQYRYGCESFKRLSHVCDKEKCPLFNKTLNEVQDTETIKVGE